MDESIDFLPYLPGVKGEVFREMFGGDFPDCLLPAKKEAGIDGFPVDHGLQMVAVLDQFAELREEGQHRWAQVPVGCESFRLSGGGFVEPFFPAKENFLGMVRENMPQMMLRWRIKGTHTGVERWVKE